MSCFFYVSDYRPFLRDYSRKAQWRSVPWLRQAMSARVAPTKGDSFGVVLSGNRGEPGLQFLPNIVRRRLYALPTPMGIEGIVQQPPGLRLLLKVGEEVDQRELDPLGQRGEGGDHIGADGVLPSRRLHNLAPAL